MDLGSTITTESSIHRKSMPHIRSDISLEYVIVTQPELARSIRSEYDNGAAA